MLTSDKLISDIRNYCINNSNEEDVIKYQRYFKEKYNGYGLSTPQINQKAKDVLTNNKVSIETVLKAMPLLLEHGKFEEISCGLMIINGLEKEYSKKTFSEISELYKYGITNWAHADILGMYILPKFLLQNIVNINDFKEWMQSPYKFQRRSVPVTFIKKVKKDRACSDCIKFIVPLIDDTEREVHQGIGWFLRECWKIERNLTEQFLMKWKDKAPRLIIYYACEKMIPEEKLKFKRSK